MARILVAEDDRDIRELIRMVLEFQGLEVTTTGDGETALDLGLRGEFDIILLDVLMPKISGLEICRKLRAAKSTRQIPVLFISAKGQESEIQAGLDAGADAYIVKPFTAQDLSRTINANLRKS